MVGSLRPDSTSTEWIDAANELVGDLAMLRSDVPLRSDDPDQLDAMALISWDLVEFVQSAVELCKTRRWSVAFGLGRLIQERVEHLIAAHHDPSFATDFMDRSRSIDGEQGPPRGRAGVARGLLRRYVEERTGDELAAHILKGLISRRDWGSLPVHASAVVPAMALAATEGPDGQDARFIAYQVASDACLAVSALVMVAEDRRPDLEIVQTVREHVQRAISSITSGHSGAST